MDNQTSVQQIDLDWAYRFIGFGPVVLISTTDGMKRDVSTVAWVSPCSKNPPTLMIAMGRDHLTWKNIMKTGWFAVNVPTADQLDLVMYCGTVSGRDVDKFSDRSIRVLQGTANEKLPLLADCAAWLECRIIPWVEAGDHSVLVAEVKAASCKEGVLLPDHSWDAARFPTLHHLGGRKFIKGSEILVA